MPDCYLKLQTWVSPDSLAPQLGCLDVCRHLTPHHPNRTLYLLLFHPPNRCLSCLLHQVTQHIPSPTGSKAQESPLIHPFPLPHPYQPICKSCWLSLQDITQIRPLLTNPSGPTARALSSLIANFLPYHTATREIF